MPLPDKPLVTPAVSEGIKVHLNVNITFGIDSDTELDPAVIAQYRELLHNCAQATLAMGTTVTLAVFGVEDDAVLTSCDSPTIQ